MRSCTLDSTSRAERALIFTEWLWLFEILRNTSRFQASLYRLFVNTQKSERVRFRNLCHRRAHAHTPGTTRTHIPDVRHTRQAGNGCRALRCCPSTLEGPYREQGINQQFTGHCAVADLHWSGYIVNRGANQKFAGHCGVAHLHWSGYTVSRGLINNSPGTAVWSIYTEVPTP